MCNLYIKHDSLQYAVRTKDCYFTASLCAQLNSRKFEIIVNNHTLRAYSTNIHTFFTIAVNPEYNHSRTQFNLIYIIWHMYNRVKWIVFLSTVVIWTQSVCGHISDQGQSTKYWLDQHSSSFSLFVPFPSVSLPASRGSTES